MFLESEDNRNDNSIFKPSASALNQRGIAILKYIPFAVPFLQRVRVSNYVQTRVKSIYFVDFIGGRNAIRHTASLGGGNTVVWQICFYVEMKLYAEWLLFKTITF